jgi:alpha-1,6-mannosyltransferase
MRLAALAFVTIAASLACPILHARLGFSAFRILYAIELALFVLAAIVVWRSVPADPKTARRELVVILGAAVLFRLALVWQTPFLSDDAYRYVWDGKVQASGINPYRHVPEAPELVPLRDAEIFPNINRRSYAPTIYPPLAQVTFLSAYLVGGGSLLGTKLVMVAVDLAGVFILVLLLLRLKEDPRKVIAYAWHPLVCWEVAHSGHVDAVAVALLAGAMLASSASRRALTGLLLGAATLVKGYPLVLVPAFARRGGVRFFVAFLAAFLLYLPYAGVGRQVLGFLPTYVREEGIDTGERFVLLRVIRLAVPLPTLAYVAIAAAIFAWVSIASLRRQHQDLRTEARAAATLAALTLALGTPHYAWYSLWLIALSTVAPRPAWLYLSSAAALHYYAPNDPTALLWFDAVQFVPLVALLLWERVAASRRVRGGAWWRRGFRP